MTASAEMAKDGVRSPAKTAGAQQSELAGLIERNVKVDGMHATAIPRLFLMRASQITEPMPAVYEPSVCIVAQGRKQVMLAEQLYFYDQAQYLVVTVDLPVMGQVIEATPSPALARYRPSQRKCAGYH